MVTLASRWGKRLDIILNQAEVYILQPSNWAPSYTLEKL